MSYENKLESLDYHRNGVGGHGFWVLTFTTKIEGEKRRRNFTAVCFPTECSDPDYDEEREDATPRAIRTAVFDRDELAKGNIAFAAGNSWRGDNWHAWCWEQIRARNASQRRAAETLRAQRAEEKALEAFIENTEADELAQEAFLAGYRASKA